MKICLVMESNESICKHIELPSVPRKEETVYDGREFKVTDIKYTTSVDWVIVFVKKQKFIKEKLLNDFNWEYYT